MSGNQGKPLSLMDELASAGFGPAKIESPSSSQDDFSSTLYTDPVIRLNFSDVDDITSFNEKHLQASTPLVIPSSVHTECDDITVDSDLLKVYTKKIEPPTMSENIKLNPHSDGINQSSPGGVGLNLEQELQQATSQNDSADIGQRECPEKNDLDASKNSTSLCNNVGLNLEQELQQATSQNGPVDVTRSECPLTSDLDVSKNVGLSLEQELQQATSQNDSADVSQSECPVKSDLDVSKNSVSLCNNDGLNLEQELQQVTSQNGSANANQREYPEKSDLDVSKNVGLSLEQELQQATSQNDSADVSQSECPVKSDLDVSKNSVSLCNNDGLNLEQELQQATSQNHSVDVSQSECPVKSDLDVSKNSVSLCNYDALNLEQELQQVTSQNGSANANQREYPEKSDLDVSKNVGLSLEQELQQATSQNDSVDVSQSESPIKSDLDISKNSVSLCNNDGLNLEQELQQATSQNDSVDVSQRKYPEKSDLDISKNIGLSLDQELQQATSQNHSADVSQSECLVKSDLDVSKNSVSLCNNLEQELQQATSQNDITDDEADNEIPVKIDSDINKNLMSPKNIDLSLEQELQEAISPNGNDNSIDDGSSLKSDLNSSKDDISITNEIDVSLKPQNESLNEQEVLTEMKEIEPVNKGLSQLENNKMEISIPGEMENMKPELELAGLTSFNNEIEEKEILDNDENVSDQNSTSPECSRETSRYITENSTTPVKNNDSNNSDVLNTLEYLGFDDERLKSFSDTNTPNKTATSPVHSRESDVDECGIDTLVDKSNASISVRNNKRNLRMEQSLSLTTDVSPEKKTKIDSGDNLHSSTSKTRSPEMCLKENKLPKDDHLMLGSSDYAQNKESYDDEQLKKKIEILEKQLENEQQLTTQAAELGMQVLQENHDLKDKVEDLHRKIATAEEERENERHAVKLRIQNKDFMEQQYNEEISHLKEEISKLKESLENAEKTETQHARQLKSMEYSAEQSQLKEQQLTTTIEHLEKLLKEKAEQAHHNASVTFNQMDTSHAEQIMALQQEILELQNNNTLLKSQLISNEAHIKRLGEEITLSQQSKESKDQEIDEMKYEINSYHKTLEVAQTEILDLKAQLHAAQIENSSHKDRGNSLFSEIEDRRVLAEKTVATLQRNYQALKERYDVEKQQHHKLKMQAVSLLHMNSGKVSDEYVKQLNSMLRQAKNEVKELQEKVKNYQKNEAQQTEKMVKIQNTFGTNENREYIDFLKSLNDIKQKELDEVKEKLNDMEMQYLQETTKVVDHIKKGHLIEEEARSLRCTNMKLKLRNEELMMKYNPDELFEGKSMPKTCVEKIPLGPTENIAKSLMKQKTRHKNQSKVSAENETKPRAQQIAELVRCGAINPVDVLKESPKAKKKAVSMASEVTVIYNDGKEEKKVNLDDDDENVPVKLERRRPQGKVAPVDKIIEVKSPVHGRREDCKQQ